MAWSAGVRQNVETTRWLRLRIRATRAAFRKMKYQDTIDISTSNANTKIPTASVWRRKFAKLIVVRASVGCMVPLQFSRPT